MLQNITHTRTRSHAHARANTHTVQGCLHGPQDCPLSLVFPMIKTLRAHLLLTFNLAPATHNIQLAESPGCPGAANAELALAGRTPRASSWFR